MRALFFLPLLLLCTNSCTTADKKTPIITAGQVCRAIQKLKSKYDLRSIPKGNTSDCAFSSQFHHKDPEMITVQNTLGTQGNHKEKHSYHGWLINDYELNVFHKNMKIAAVDGNNWTLHTLAHDFPTANRITQEIIDKL